MNTWLYRHVYNNHPYLKGLRLFDAVAIYTLLSKSGAHASESLENSKQKEHDVGPSTKTESTRYSHLFHILETINKNNKINEIGKINENCKI